MEQFVHGNNSLIYSSPSLVCCTFLINQLCLISTNGSAIDACCEGRDDCVLLVATFVITVDAVDILSFLFYVIGKIVLRNQIKKNDLLSFIPTSVLGNAFFLFKTKLIIDWLNN